MKRIDSHQHFWMFDPIRDSWITEEMKVIKKDFLPADLQPILKQHGFDGCVTVQSDQSYNENRFQLHNATENDFIKGIVGWVDLASSHVERDFEYLSQFEKIKGFRHVLQGEPQRDLMLQRAFVNGISLLGKYNYTYDILIFKDQLQYLPKFISAFPDQRFILDHIAKPDIKNNDIDQWKKDISVLGQFENLYCKVSGMVTEANWKTWKKEDFKPFLDTVVETFGVEKIMFGSDWPVCLVAASYTEVVAIVEDYFSSFSKNEQENFFGLNAIKFYNL